MEALNSTAQLRMEDLYRQLSELRQSLATAGIGFEPQFAEQIFEVFQRLHGRDIYPGRASDWRFAAASPPIITAR